MSLALTFIAFITILMCGFAMGAGWVLARPKLRPKGRPQAKLAPPDAPAAQRWTVHTDGTGSCVRILLKRGAQEIRIAVVDLSADEWEDALSDAQVKATMQAAVLNGSAEVS